MAATCRSCRAPLDWADTPAGKKIPLDKTPVDQTARGALILVEAGHRNWAYSFKDLVAKVSLREGVSETRAAEMIGQQYEARLSHFSTCPNSERHRRPR